MAAIRATSRIAASRTGAAISRLLCAVPIARLPGCARDSEPATSQIASNSTVADYVSSGCSTSVVSGLSRQISDEIAGEHPGGLTSFAPGGNLTITNNSVLLYLAAGAKTDLISEAASHSVQVNSAFRTIAQQYLLYRWYANGRCGITAAATVGNSNHESGRAVDLATWSSVVTSMRAHGWKHDVRHGDPGRRHGRHLVRRDDAGDLRRARGARAADAHRRPGDARPGQPRTHRRRGRAGR